MFLDIFAWIVLVFLVASAIAIFSSPARCPDTLQDVERAPADGYVTNLGLKKGARVASIPLAPVMAFIDTSETVVGVEIQQIYSRYIEPGHDVEVTFKFFPGQVFTGKVVAVLQSLSTGQILASGAAATTKQIVAAPFAVRVKLDDDKLAASLSTPRASRRLTSFGRSSCARLRY
jgi:multidrug resistance efflux pump